MSGQLTSAAELTAAAEVDARPPLRLRDGATPERGPRGSNCDSGDLDSGDLDSGDLGLSCMSPFWMSFFLQALQRSRPALQARFRERADERARAEIVHNGRTPSMGIAGGTKAHAEVIGLYPRAAGVTSARGSRPCGPSRPPPHVVRAQGADCRPHSAWNSASMAATHRCSRGRKESGDLPAQTRASSPRSTVRRSVESVPRVATGTHGFGLRHSGHAGGVHRAQTKIEPKAHHDGVRPVSRR